MTRKIWQGDFARLWFGAGPAKRRRRAPRMTAASGAQRADPAGAEPLGIVERNRRARREKWALKLDQ